MRTRGFVGRRYVIALLIVALVTVVQFVIIRNQIIDQRKEGIAVSIAERQRTLADRIINITESLVAANSPADRLQYRDWLVKDVDALERGERELRSGDAEFNPPGWPPATVRNLFDGGIFDVARRTRDFIRHARMFSIASKNMRVDRGDDLRFLRDTSSTLEYCYSRILTAYVAAKEQRHTQLLWFECGGLLAVLFTLWLELQYIFRPMQRRLDDKHRLLSLEAENLRRAQRTARLGSWERNVASGEATWSPELRRMLGFTAEEPLPELLSRVHSDDVGGLRAEIERSIQNRTAYQREFRLITRTGETRWVRAQGQPREPSDHVSTWRSGTVFDITERKIAEEDAERQRSYDSVTGLPNRLLLHERAAALLATAERRNSMLAVMFVHLDRFENVTDGLEHATADRAVCAVADRLRRGVRAGDTVARIGDGEFALVLDDIGSRENARTLAQELVAASTRPYLLDGEEFYATASIGVSLFPTDARDIATLLRVADSTMRRAAAYAGGSYQFNSIEGYSEKLRVVALERDLRHALEREQFELYYQPIVTLAGVTTGAEALLRWRHPSLGTIAPGDFIALAEETGLIVPIGDWILRTACARARSWRRSEDDEVRIAVNISGRQFRSPTFCDRVETLLVESGLPASCLELEITESVLMHEVERAIETLARVKTLGIGLSIDDFGTGYSSLAYLKRFPLDTLKIDRAFICEVTNDRSDDAIVRAILTLARNLGLRVVAEGVETREQLEYLEAVRCDEVQGFFISRPMPGDAIDQWMRARPLAAARSISPR